MAVLINEKGVFTINEISLGLFAYLPALLIVIGIFLKIKEPLKPKTTNVKHNMVINEELDIVSLENLISFSFSEVF